MRERAGVRGIGETIVAAEWISRGVDVPLGPAVDCTDTDDDRRAEVGERGDFKESSEGAGEEGSGGYIYSPISDGTSGIGVMSDKAFRDNVIESNRDISEERELSNSPDTSTASRDSRTVVPEG